jgi:dienelactone hydrolase
VSIKIYAGVRHSFDTYLPPTRVPEARRGRGATIGGDASARQDSIEQTRTFFARYLEPASSSPRSLLPR